VSRIDQVRNRVLSLFRKDSTIAVNYSHLCFEYWREYDCLQYEANTGTYYVAGKEVGRLQSPESITRAFRELVEEEKIVVPDHVKQLRSELEEEYREYYGRREREEL
jgi:hypothetical protein